MSVSTDTDQSRGLTLPSKVIVSLRAGAVLAIANVVCVIIFSWAWTKVKSEPQTISVTGSAKKVIVSDLITWQGRISVLDPELTPAYDGLKIASDKTLAFIRAAGVPDSEVTVSSIGTTKRRERDEKGNEKQKIIAYELSQTIQIESKDLKRVTEVSRSITGLIKEGVVMESNAPQYLYTKLADLKIDMLAEATKDATTRAEKIASNSRGQLGSIIEARMGVMQINPIHSTDVSSTGNNDTSSLDKEITAIVAARYSLK